jgi:3-deoxy-7-phosphoheptulonate synthase
LPVIADPSHGIGIRSHVSKIALAAMVAGADGIITEIHHEPEKAFSDGQQTLNFEEFDALLIQLRKIHKALN